MVDGAPRGLHRRSDRFPPCRQRPPGAAPRRAAALRRSLPHHADRDRRRRATRARALLPRACARARSRPALRLCHKRSRGIHPRRARAGNAVSLPAEHDFERRALQRAIARPRAAREPRAARDARRGGIQSNTCTRSDGRTAQPRRGRGSGGAGVAARRVVFRRRRSRAAARADRGLGDGCRATAGGGRCPGGRVSKYRSGSRISRAGQRAGRVRRAHARGGRARLALAHGPRGRAGPPDTGPRIPLARPRRAHHGVRLARAAALEPAGPLPARRALDDRRARCGPGHALGPARARTGPGSAAAARAALQPGPRGARDAARGVDRLGGAGRGARFRRRAPRPDLGRRSRTPEPASRLGARAAPAAERRSARAGRGLSSDRDGREPRGGAREKRADGARSAELGRRGRTGRLRPRGALPEARDLHRSLERALRGLPYRADAFTPFERDVEAARLGPLLTIEGLRGTGLDLKVQSLLATRDGEWHALIPLRGVRDPARLRSLAERLPEGAGASFLGLKAESDRLIGGYRSQTLVLAGLGALAIAVLLCFGLRSLRAALQVMLPVYAAIAMTVACLTLLGIGLSLFHLVSLLLVLGIGLNYSLFFSRAQPGTDSEQGTSLALSVCFLTTFAAFGCLATSRIPILSAIGLTVTLGCALSLLNSMILGGAAAREREAR